MAQFDLITLEQNALKREKIERRRGPKPVRTSLLWAQTPWLEGNIALIDRRVIFQNDERQWDFDGALLETTQRALDKLAFRSLSQLESERLATRRKKLALWRVCASLENFSSAHLVARLVLESLLVAPLEPSAAREFLRLSGREQRDILREMEGEIFPARTREFMHWVVCNRGFEFWRGKFDFPVNLACRLGFAGNVIPTIFQNEGGLALGMNELVALVETHDSINARQIAEFWCEACWQWTDVRPVSAVLKRREAINFRHAWREIELKWRSQWIGLWREIASHSIEAARSALQFHEILVDKDFSTGLRQVSSRNSAERAQVFDWCETRNNRAFDLLQCLRGHVDCSALIEFLSELWLEYEETPTEEFWNGVLVPTFKAARLIGVAAARELRSNDHLCLVGRLGRKPELLRLASEWARRGEGIEWYWQMASFSANERDVAFLRREAQQFFALCDRFPLLDALARGALWDKVLVHEEERGLKPLYWRLVRVLAPIFITKIQEWHSDNASNLGDWLSLWAGVGCELGWREEEVHRFCEAMLGNIEGVFRVMDGIPPRLDDIENALETYVYLCNFAGQTIEQTISRTQLVLQWLTHGKVERVEDWWEARTVARKLSYRPRFCAALLLASKRSPGCIREILPQIESLRRLHLTEELDGLEDEIAPPDGELGELLTRFPTLQEPLVALNEWQRRLGETPCLPKGVRDVLAYEDKWRREASFLRDRISQKPDIHLQVRLRNLETRLETGVANANIESELADVLEAAGEDAISATLRDMVTRALKRRLRVLCGAVAHDLVWNNDWGNALLLACGIESNRKWAMKLLRGQSQNISGWQRHIPANQDWLREFAASGKDIEAFEAVCHSHIGEWELWIERDALQILQMGNRFSTCLSRGGCNAHSTIANALDANKLVVYGRRNGQIQARQLWGITSQGALGGFHIYANLSQAAREKSGLEPAFSEFARCFAQKCGLELNEDQGAEIPEICGAAWYNDGLISWERLANPNNEKEEKNPRVSSCQNIMSKRRAKMPRSPKYRRKEKIASACPVREFEMGSTNQNLPVIS